MRLMMVGTRLWNRPKDIPAPEAARIEAETMNLVTNFKVTNSGQASSGSWLQADNPGTESIANYTHALGNGNFSITIVYFDESDGQSPFAIYKNNVQFDSWIWDTDADQSTGNASSASRVERVLPTQSLVNGDVIEIRGTAHAAEAMRVDYLDFTPV